MAYCPSCISFKGECNPDTEDYSGPCSYFKETYAHCEKCGWSYHVDVGCMCEEAL